MIGRILLVALVIAAAAPATAAPFHAEPQVEVVEAPVNGAAPGAIVLRNDDDTATVTAGSITAEPGCDPAVQLAPLTGFMLGPHGSTMLTVTCAAAPAGMRRCNYRVRAPSSAPLLDFEAVCASAGAASLVPDVTMVEFGTVAIGDSASQTVTLTNTGATALTRLFVETTDLAGNFAVAAPCNPDARECDAPIANLAPGASRKLTVTCTPRSMAAASALLYITSPAGTRLATPIMLTCKTAAATAPVLSAIPSAIDVGAVELIGGTARATVHVSNAGIDNLRLLDVQIVDGGTGAAADWKLTAHLPCSPGIPPLCVLAGGGSTDLDLELDPSALAARNATLLIQFRDTEDRSLSIPLRGSGRGATLDLVGGQTILEFGTLPLNTLAKLEIQVANRGTRDLIGAKISLQPAGPPFSVAPGPPFSVAAASSTKLAVTCSAASAGLFAATLTLSADDITSAPIAIPLHCTGDPTTTLTATPPALVLGEVRVDTPRITAFDIAAVTDAQMLQSATLANPVDPLSVRGVPATTPASLDLTAAPLDDGSLANQVIVTPASGSPLKLAVTGTAVTADYGVAPSVSLGTFCIGQPTTPRTLRLTSTATATINLLAPTLQSSDSDYDLEPIAPITYPASLAPLATAMITAIPKRRDIDGDVTDNVIWKTDVAGRTIAVTMLTATFVKAGGAIAPGEVTFEPAPIHLDIANGQEVALKNCNDSPLQLDPPVVPAPFSIDSPNFPSVLGPHETATFSVGFHPTKLDRVTRTLVITSPQLPGQLTVTMTGMGKIEGDGGGSGSDDASGSNRTSFYACGGCASHDAPGALIFAAAVLLVVRRKRSA